MVICSPMHESYSFHLFYLLDLVKLLDILILFYYLTACNFYILIIIIRFHLLANLCNILVCLYEFVCLLLLKFNATFSSHGYVMGARFTCQEKNERENNWPLIGNLEKTLSIQTEVVHPLPLEVSWHYNRVKQDIWWNSRLLIDTDCCWIICVSSLSWYVW